MSATSNLSLGFGARIMLCLGLVLAAQPAWAQAEMDGRKIAQRNCSQCHAIGPTGDSRLKGAPPFRDLSMIEDMDDLVAALHGGLLMRHPAMPELRLTQKEITSLAAYLRDVQARRSVSLKIR